MPRFDGTGPRGRGPLSGRGWGYCVDRPARGYGFGGGPRRGRGFGYGPRGYGRGFGRGYGPYWAEEAPDYPDLLADETHALKAEIERLNARLSELEVLGKGQDKKSDDKDEE